MRIFLYLSVFGLAAVSFHTVMVRQSLAGDAGYSADTAENNSDPEARENLQKKKPSGPVVADFSAPKEELKDPTIVQLEDLPADAPVAEFVEGIPQSQRRYIYEKPTYKALANLYWALGYTDLENDTHIDNYLKLTECKIFRRYNASEFEWQEIRAATRKFISANRSDFPMRFELVQTVKLEDYDMKRRAFKITARTQIQSIRRFEMLTTDDLKFARCYHKGKEMEGFPVGVILELSRPFNLTYVPVPQDVAESYIQMKNAEFQKLSVRSQTKQLLYDMRTAYIVIYAKIFAFRKLERSMFQGYKVLQTMAVMEGFEVYGDYGRKLLFYSKSFVNTQSPKEVSAKLLKEYEVLRTKYNGDGVFH